MALDARRPRPPACGLPLLLLALMTAHPLAAQSADRSLPPEEGFLVPVAPRGLRVFLRHQPPAPGTARSRSPVLFVHGASFPSALAAAFRFDGVSWMDHLAARGFDVWALDFLGYGRSDRYPEMREPADANPPLGRTPDAARQIAAAVEFIASRTAAGARVSLVAHSWGTMPAGYFAGAHPERIDRLVLFGPVTERQGPAPALDGSAWIHVTEAEQESRFTGYVPPDAERVLEERHFAVWGSAYMATDSTASARTPPSVRIPNGWAPDLAAAWSGALPWDPAKVTAPVLIVRGEWETITTDDDARWLWSALARAPVKRDVKIDRGTHVMHLERSRYQLYAEVAAFLAAGDLPPAPEPGGRTAPGR